MTTSAISRADGSGHSAPVAAATSRRPGERARPGRIEGLDGLRALAIIGVLVYHLNAAWLPGWDQRLPQR